MKTWRNLDRTTNTLERPSVVMIDTARTLFSHRYSFSTITIATFHFSDLFFLSAVLIWWVWCITYLTWPTHGNYCSTTSRPHVTTCSRPSRFLTWNIESWMWPGDEARGFLELNYVCGPPCVMICVRYTYHVVYMVYEVCAVWGMIWSTRCVRYVRYTHGVWSMYHMVYEVC